MRAWFYDSPLSPIRLEDNAADPRPGEGEVVVQVRAAGLCHTDVGFLDGTLTGILRDFPVVLGHEFSGVVTEVGNGVDGFAPGDRVAVDNMGGYGSFRNGGYEQYTVAATRDLIPIPGDLSFEQAAIATCGGRTAYRGVVVAGGVEAGMKVGIVGLGGIGLLGAQIAKARGAEVYAAEINEAVWPNARHLGITETVKRAKDLAPYELDVIIDFAGFSDTLAGAVEAIKAGSYETLEGGRIVCAGLGEQYSTIDVVQMVTKMIEIRTTSGGTAEDVANVMAMMANGSVGLRTERIAFDEIGNGLDRLQRGNVSSRLVATMDA
ncbi:alcohol dehydrogenase catalytic domain-containing protein [Rhodococcus aetherivorans]